MHHTIDAVLTWEAVEGQAWGEGRAKALGSGLTQVTCYLTPGFFLTCPGSIRRAGGREALPTRAVGTEVGPFAKGRCGIKDGTLNQEPETCAGLTTAPTQRPQGR